MRTLLKAGLTLRKNAAVPVMIVPGKTLVTSRPWSLVSTVSKLWAGVNRVCVPAVTRTNLVLSARFLSLRVEDISRYTWGGDLAHRVAHCPQSVRLGLNRFANFQEIFDFCTCVYAFLSFFLSFPVSSKTLSVSCLIIWGVSVQEKMMDSAGEREDSNALVQGCDWRRAVTLWRFSGVDAVSVSTAPVMHRNNVLLIVKGLLCMTVMEDDVTKCFYFQGRCKTWFPLQYI